MMNRGRGNFQNGGFRNNVPQYTAEQMARMEADRRNEEKARRDGEKKVREDFRTMKRGEKEARKAEERLRWPDIQPDYKPEMWRQKYQEDHCEKLSESVDLLQTMKGWSREEALSNLLDILVKITFIESNLTVNGPRTAEELFDNLQLAQGDAPIIPFESPETLAEFCNSMPLNFHKERGRRYRNTGVQGRRLVQWLKGRLEQGKVIDEDTFDDVKEAFCETIQVPEGQRMYACAEPGMDYGSLWDLGKIPGFKYDKTTGRLSLTPEAAKSLPLNLPIFTDTINSKHPRKLDYSRKIKTFVTNVATDHMFRTELLVNSEEMSGVPCAFYRKKLANEPATIDRPFSLIHGCARPNDTRNQIEVFTVETTSFCAVNNPSTKSSSRTTFAGKTATPDFHEADLSQQHYNKLITTRPRIDKKNGEKDNKEENQ